MEGQGELWYLLTWGMGTRTGLGGLCDEFFAKFGRSELMFERLKD